MRPFIPLLLILSLLFPFAAYAADTPATCPVGISATRQAVGSTMLAGSAPNDPSAHGLRISLSSRSPLVGAEIVLYGLTPKTRFVPIDSHSPDTISKTFELHGRLTVFDLWMSQVSALQQVELRSVTYADGTAWHASATESCRIAPSDFVLVAIQ